MNPARVITYDGFTGTLREWSARSGIGFATLSSRLARGMPVAKALKMPAQPAKYLTPSKIIKYRGRKGTMAQWAKWLGLSEAGLRHRFYRGRTMEEALSEFPHRMPARLHGQTEISASSKLQCFCCGCPLSVWKSGYYSTFIGVIVPVCGAPDCSGTDAYRPPRTLPAVVRQIVGVVAPPVSER